MTFPCPCLFPWGDTVDKYLILSWKISMCTPPYPSPCLYVLFFFLFTPKKFSCNEKLRPLNHLCVSVRESSQDEMNLKVVPWFEENLRVIAFHHLCAKPSWACMETAAFGWLIQIKVTVHSGCLVLAPLIRWFLYGVDWEKLVVD